MVMLNLSVDSSCLQIGSRCPYSGFLKLTQSIIAILLKACLRSCPKANVAFSLGPGDGNRTQTQQRVREQNKHVPCDN